jgi:hypothetical protein
LNKIYVVKYGVYKFIILKGLLMRVLFIIISVLILSGCKEQSSQEKLLALQDDVVKCVSSDSKSSQCELSKKKYAYIREGAMELSSDPQQFGQDVLSLQLRLSETTNEEERLKLKTRLAKHMQLLALFSSPQ